MRFIINFSLGMIFGFGLLISNIFDSTKAKIFLLGSMNWNLSLLATILSSIIVSIILLLLLKTIFQITEDSFLTSQKKSLDRHSLIGSALFGVGWGLTGLCVSTATLNLVFNQWESILFFVFMALGFYAPQFFKNLA